MFWAGRIFCLCLRIGAGASAQNIFSSGAAGSSCARTARGGHRRGMTDSITAERGLSALRHRISNIAARRVNLRRVSRAMRISN